MNHSTRSGKQELHPSSNIKQPSKSPMQWHPTKKEVGHKEKEPWPERDSSEGHICPDNTYTANEIVRYINSGPGLRLWCICTGPGRPIILPNHHAIRLGISFMATGGYLISRKRILEDFLRYLQTNPSFFSYSIATFSHMEI